MERTRSLEDEKDESSQLERSHAECPECGSRPTKTAGEIACSDCGLVLKSDRIDHGPEWRSIGDTSTRRTGAPLTNARHDRGLSTQIGFRDGKNQPLPSHVKRRFRRLRRHHSRSKTPRKVDRNRMKAFIEIKHIVTVLGLSSADRKMACQYFRRAHDSGMLVGRSLDGFAAAAVYAVCRVTDNPRTPEELLDAARADRAAFTTAYQTMNREIGLPTAPTDPRAYLPRFISDLDLSIDVERRARELVETATKAGWLSGRKPSGVAAGCIYLAAQEHGVSITQTAISEVAEVSPVTLRNTYQDLLASE